MSLIELILGPRSSNSAEDQLWAMDLDEEEDLALHVRNDGRKWAVTVRLLRDLQRASIQIRTILIVIAALIAVNGSPQIGGMLQSLLRSLLGGG